MHSRCECLQSPIPFIRNYAISQKVTAAHSLNSAPSPFTTFFNETPPATCLCDKLHLCLSNNLQITVPPVWVCNRLPSALARRAGPDPRRPYTPSHEPCRACGDCTGTGNAPRGGPQRLSSEGRTGVRPDACHSAARRRLFLASSASRCVVAALAFHSPSRAASSQQRLDRDLSKAASRDGGGEGTLRPCQPPRQPPWCCKVAVEAPARRPTPCRSSSSAPTPRTSRWTRRWPSRVSPSRTRSRVRRPPAQQPPPESLGAFERAPWPPAALLAPGIA